MFEVRLRCYITLEEVSSLLVQRQNITERQDKETEKWRDRQVLREKERQRDTERPGTHCPPSQKGVPCQSGRKQISKLAP